MKEINDTTRTYPRTMDEARQFNHWPLDADEANPISGPWDDHGLKSMKHYEDVAAYLGFALVCFVSIVGTMVIIHWME